MMDWLVGVVLSNLFQDSSTTTNEVKEPPPFCAETATEPVPGTRLPFGRIALVSILAPLVLAVLLNWIPVLLALTVPFLLELIAFAIKFRRDNRNLVSGVTRWRFIASSLFGFLRFIPSLLIFAVACLIVWGFDFVVGKGTDQLKHREVESEELMRVKRPIVVDWHPLSPWRLFGSKKNPSAKNIEFTEGQSVSIKFAVKTAVKFLEVVTWYPWFFLAAC